MAFTFEKYITGDDASVLIDEGSTRLAQSFTIGTTAQDLTFKISSIDLFLLTKESGLGSGTLEVYETDASGAPTGSPISTGAPNYGLLKDFAEDSTEWLNVTMSEATLKASTKYAMVLYGEGIGDPLSWRKDGSAATYTGGNVLNSTDTGASWTQDTDDDFLFQVNGGDYEGTLCTLADAVNKAGANANSNSTNESLMSDWVRQAEGKIACVTQFDWVDAYASISDDVKFILNETASEIAGIKAITYDMSGYTTETAEAETMINVYRENINFNLNLLSQERVKDFLESDS